MAEPPTVELSRGFSHPRELVGRTLILRPRHDVGFPLVVGIFSALIAVALGFVVAVTTHSLGINVLVAIELALAIGIQICYDWFFPEAAACLADYRAIWLPPQKLASSSDADL